jgi:WhiB family redox-sensing transcriptional regulator
MTTAFREDWAMAAKCRGTGDVLFVQGAAQRQARVLCDGCPVRRECLAEALDDRIEWGVWGGMRTRPDVTSWRALLLQESLPVR